VRGGSQPVFSVGVVMASSFAQGDNSNWKISVACVDPLPLFRAGIAQALRQSSDFELVAEGQTAMDAVQLARRRPLDILMLDIKLPGGGSQALETISRTLPAIKLVVISACEEEEDVATAMRMGSRGYILKDVTAIELIGALKSIAKGESYMAPSLGARLLSRQATPTHRTPSAESRIDELTQREVQILSQVSVGATNKEIARTFSISEKTVKYYMTSIMQKLQVRNRVEAVVLMRRGTGTSG
jgi:two-component system, NarL family, nitrate/nitrite response regulator NarL